MWFVLLGTLLLLLLFSAFFSATETAVTGLNLPVLNEKAKKGNKKAKLILALLKDKAGLIGTILMLNTFINIFFTTFSTSLSVDYFGHNFIFLTGLVNALLILILGEIVPKTYAFNNPDTFVLKFAPFIFIFVKLVTPFSKILVWINNALLRLTKTSSLITSSGDNNSHSSVESLRGAIDLFQGTSSKENNTLQEKEMLHSLLDLYNIALSEIMVHRKNVKCVDKDANAEDVIIDLINSDHTKIPVYKGSTDNIIGILYTKEVLKGYFKDKENFNLAECLRKPTYFPETTSAFDLLIHMQKHRDKIVVIVDEYGTFMGIICVDDILEEIVGELKFSAARQIQKVNNSYIVNGDITIRDLNRKIRFSLPDDNATTVAGLILYETGRIPNVGNIFEFYSYRFEIIEKKTQQITKIKITALKQ